MTRSPADGDEERFADDESGSAADAVDVDAVDDEVVSFKS
jgi:hypothetical protein